MTQRHEEPPRSGNAGPNGGGDLLGRSFEAQSKGYSREERGTSTSLRTLVKVLHRRLPLLILCTLIVPAVALAWSVTQDETYESSATLLFRDPDLGQAVFDASVFSPSDDPSRAAETNVELVSLGVVAQRAAGELKVDGLDAGTVSDSVEVDQEGQSDLATITASAETPVLAARIANVFAGQYIAFRREADRNKVREAQALVERQLESLPTAAQAGPEGAELQGQARQLEILAALQTGNAELVQRALPSESPASPKPKRNVAVGLLFGLLLGVGIAFVLEQFDRRMKDVAAIEDAFGLPVLATIPHSKNVAPMNAADPIGLGAPGAEAFRKLHANLRYFNVGRNITSVLATSADAQEGKTTVCWGMAVAEARSGKSVLLIEADMRMPTLAGRIGQSHSAGLSLVLAGVERFEDALVKPQIESSGELDVLLSGPGPPNPAELLESAEMAALLKRAQASYDLVIIDSPPTLVADAVPLISQVSGVLIVARLGQSRRDSAENLSELLGNLNAPTLGAVINDGPQTQGSYYMPYAARVGASTQA